MQELNKRNSKNHMRVLKSVLAIQRKSNVTVKLFQAFLFLLLSAIIVVSALSWHKTSAEKDRNDSYIKSQFWARRISWGFLFLAIVLIWCTSFLMYVISSRRAKLKHMPNTFQSESRKLKIFMIIFSAFYILRYLSDYILIPNIAAAKNQEICYVNGRWTGCMPYFLTLYYLWSSFVWDFFPIALIMYFHHRSFRLQGGSRSS